MPVKIADDPDFVPNLDIEVALAGVIIRTPDRDIIPDRKAETVETGSGMKVVEDPLNDPIQKTGDVKGDHCNCPDVTWSTHAFHCDLTL